MTRHTFTDFAKKSDAELAGFSLVETTALESLVRQANAAQAERDAAIAAHDAEKAELVAKHKDELAAKNNELRARTVEWEDATGLYMAAIEERDAALAKLASCEGTDEYKAKRLAELQAAKDAAIAAAAKADAELAKLV